MNKNILLASFIFPERLDWFLNHLNKKFNITKDKIFCYKNLDDESKIIVTYKLPITYDKNLNRRELLPNVIPIHKKGNAIYTINALNKLIESIHTNILNRSDYKLFVINWDDYQNKLILLNSNQLTIFNIKRIF